MARLGRISEGFRVPKGWNRIEVPWNKIPAVPPVPAAAHDLFHLHGGG